MLTRLRQAVRLLVVDALNGPAWDARARYKVDHPYIFDRATLKAMLAASGWRIVGTWIAGNDRYIGHVCKPAR